MTYECLSTWPTDATDGDLLPPYIRPEHRCMLPASHVRQVVDLFRVDEHGHSAPAVEPHRCHCGAWLPVRDAEPAL